MKINFLRSDRSLNKKFLFLGGLGIQDNIIGGQTIKNRTLVVALTKHIGKDYFSFLDTSECKNNPLMFVYNFLLKYFNINKIIFSVSKKGLLYLLVPVTFLNIILRKKSYYIVIGGWLPQILEKSFFLKNVIKRQEIVFVETRAMLSNLQQIGLENVVQIPNFKDFSYLPKEKNETLNAADVINIYFLGRVCKDKGIELAAEAITNINAQLSNKKIFLDVYGPIEKGYEKKFEELISDSKYITYKGIIDLSNENNYEIISKYDFMLFPTFWHGEGFPGAIIDSFIAGTPVYASNWAYNSEIIKDGLTGRIFNAKDSEAIVQKLLRDIEHPEKLLQMRKNCVEEAKKYHVDTVIPELLKEISIK